MREREEEERDNGKLHFLTAAVQNSPNDSNGLMGSKYWVSCEELANDTRRFLTCSF